MSHEPVKFFQVGSFAAGNRLLGLDARTVQSARERSNTTHVRPPRLPGVWRGARRAVRARRGDARNATDD